MLALRRSLSGYQVLALGGGSRPFLGILCVIHMGGFRPFFCYQVLAMGIPLSGYQLLVVWGGFCALFGYYVLALGQPLLGYQVLAIGVDPPSFGDIPCLGARPFLGTPY